MAQNTYPSFITAGSDQFEYIVSTIDPNDAGVYYITAWQETFMPSTQLLQTSGTNISIELEIKYDMCYISHIEDPVEAVSYTFVYTIEPENEDNSTYFEFPFFTNDVERLFPDLWDCGEIHYDLNKNFGTGLGALTT